MLKQIKKATTLLLIAVTMTTVSCTKDEDNGKSSSTGNDAYYVKYEVSYYHGYSSYFLEVNYLTPNGMMEAWTRDHDGGVYVFSAYAGPFKKGDRTYIACEGPFGKGPGKLWMSISVKHGDEPFCVKKSVRDLMECEYYIE